MKKILIINVLVALTLLNAVSLRNMLKVYPMDIKYMSVTNGGDLKDINAYMDGIGFFITGNVDNSAMNAAVFKYGEEAKELGITLEDIVANKEGTDISNKLKIMDIETTPIEPVAIKSTINCLTGNIGDEYVENGVSYLIVDNNTIADNLYRVATICTSHVTDMSSLFQYYEYSYEFNESLNHWDVSNVIYMDNMFNGVELFNQDLNDWDVSNVEVMSGMFNGANSFNGHIENWNTGNVYDMSEMFKDALVFNRNISKWNINNSTYYYYFRLNSALITANSPFKTIGESCNDNNSDTSNDIYIDELGACEGTYVSCNDNNNLTVNDSIINGICVGEINPIYKDGNIVKCEGGMLNHEYLLDGLSYLVVNNNTIKYNLDRVASICTSKVTDMNNLFNEKSSFNEPLNHWDVSNVTNMYQMFYNAISFNQSIDNWDIGNVIDISSMFSGAISFNQPLNNWNVSNIIDMSFMFIHANSFSQPLNNWNVSNVINMNGMFFYAKAFNQSLNNWNVSNVINMNGMFYEAANFNQPLNGWNTSKVTNMGYMFAYATSFNQPLNNWDVSSVTDMNTMFYKTTSFNQLLSNWNVSNVINMDGMFIYAVNFNQSLNNWDVSNVTTMQQMFQNATTFNQPLNNWNTGKVTSMYNMFYKATRFNQYIKNWNVSKVTSYGDFRMNSALTAANSPF